MNDLLWVMLAGFGASFVDGALGMGFGATSSTLLMGMGLPPSVASATVNLAKVATGLASGVSHWRFGNIDRRLVLRLGLAGAAGAIVGGSLSSWANPGVLRPLVAALLLIVGLRLFVRFSASPASSNGADSNDSPSHGADSNDSPSHGADSNDSNTSGAQSEHTPAPEAPATEQQRPIVHGHFSAPRRTRAPQSTPRLPSQVPASGQHDPALSDEQLRGSAIAGLGGGLVNGLIGAWGPLVTPYLLYRKVAPRYAIGTANTAEMFVAAVAAVTLIWNLGVGTFDFRLLGAMLVGGVIAAPVSAWLIRFIPARPMGLATAALLIALNARELFGLWVPAHILPIAYATLAIALLTVAVLVFPRPARAAAT